jgi:glyoxylase-like metal-dependent hydrolase (beta-lactamase superfamily II)
VNGAAHRFRVGALECTALSDGSHDYTAQLYVANGEATEIERALALHGDTPSRIVSPYTCMLVETGAERVLLDTGGGDFSPGVGKLLESLRVAGIDPGEIDVVVLTHAHPDHIGGNTDDEGKLVFPNARYVIARDEWEFWSSEDTLSRVPEIFSHFVRKDLLPLADRLDLLDGESEVAPGIRMLPTPGHTPGHVAVVVAEGEDELFYISDAALHPIHLEHPDWHPIYDLDPQEALISKKMLFDRCAREGSLVLAFHFEPFPCLGHVSRAGQGWLWEPLPAERREVMPETRS